MKIGQIVKTKRRVSENCKEGNASKLVTDYYQIIAFYPRCVLLHKLIHGRPDSRIRWCPNMWELVNLLHEDDRIRREGENGERKTAQ